MSMGVKVIMAAWLVALGVGGCDGGNDATAKCDQLEEESCKRAVECGAQDSQAECLEAARAEVMCGMAKTAKPTFDTCLRDLRQATCDELMRSGLPESCETVILF